MHWQFPPATTLPPSGADAQLHDRNPTVAELQGNAGRQDSKSTVPHLLTPAATTCHPFPGTQIRATSADQTCPNPPGRPLPEANNPSQHSPLAFFLPLTTAALPPVDFDVPHAGLLISLCSPSF